MKSLTGASLKLSDFHVFTRIGIMKTLHGPGRIDDR